MAVFKYLMLGSLLIASIPAAALAKSDTPEEELAKILKDRVPGKPVDCIFQRDIQSTQIVRNTAIVYEMNNGTYYLNRPDSGASSLTMDPVLVTDTHSDQLCNVDIVRLIDRSTQFFQGSLGLGKFVPYTKPKPAK